MRRPTAIALVVGTIVGVAITTTARWGQAGEPGGIALPIFVHFGPAIGCAVIVMRMFRRWLDVYTADIRGEFDAAAEERRVFLQEVTRRQADIARREDEMNRSAGEMELRVVETFRSHVDCTADLIKLQAEYDELAAEYNSLVGDTIRESANRFRPRSPSAGTVDGDAHLIPLPLKSRLRGDTTHDRMRDAADDPALES